MFRTLLALISLQVGIYQASGAPVDVDGNPVNPLVNVQAKAVVIIFMAEDCPISNRYVPLLNRLTEKFAKEGVAMWSVYPNPGVSSKTLRKHRDEFDILMPALIDGDQTLVKKLEAEVTPEAFVLVPSAEAEKEARLIYKGRIDNQYLKFGRSRPNATKSDLQEVLEAVLAGDTPEYTETPAVGCYIVAP